MSHVGRTYGRLQGIRSENLGSKLVYFCKGPALNCGSPLLYLATAECCLRMGSLVGWLVVFNVPLVSLAKDLKLGFNSVPIGNRTPGRRVAIHYKIAAPRQLLEMGYIHTCIHTSSMEL